VNPIYLLPIGYNDRDALLFLQYKIQTRFACSASILTGIEIPERAFDRDRHQYSSSEFLRQILANSPKDAIRTLGVTPVDLFIPVLTFVFGQAQLGGKAAVVSTLRLKQEYYELPPNETVFLERLGKEAVHELGHTFGLVHCRDPRCVMHLSNKIREIDIKGDSFCESCSKLLSKEL